MILLCLPIGRPKDTPDAGMTAILMIFTIMLLIDEISEDTRAGTLTYVSIY